MRRRCITSALLLLGLLYAAPASAAGITFRTDLVANNNVLVSIDILDITDLLAFDFGVSFNDAARLVQVDEGTFLSGGGPTAFMTLDDPLDPATVRLISGLFSLNGVTGSGTLAVLLLSGVTPSDVNLRFLISPADQLGFIDSNLDFIDVAPVDTNPTPVPEPSTLGLMGVGLAALARRLRRKAPVAA